MIRKQKVEFVGKFNGYGENDIGILTWVDTVGLEISPNPILESQWMKEDGDPQNIFKSYLDKLENEDKTNFPDPNIE